jgi:putative membrane protein
MTHYFLTVLVFTFAGSALGGLISMIPSLHIYNTAGIALIVWTAFEGSIPYAGIAPFFLSMVVAYAFLNTLPMTLLGAPDESATVTILPGTKYLMTGRGYEAAAVTGIGSLMGIGILVCGAPLIFLLMPILHKILTPHLHWIIMAVIVYMLMSEWPKGEGIGDTVFQRLRHAWSNLVAGLVTFLLSGVLGLIVTSRTFVSPDAGFQNIMPVFVGLFAIPGAVQHLLSRKQIPPQHIPETVELTPSDIGYSALQGTIAGGMAAYIPAVTAGIGGIIAGHTVARRGDRLFIVSGGTAKVLYYVGAFLLLYLVTPYTPGGIGRGGLAIILKPIFQPLARELPMMMGVVLFSGCVSFLLLLTGAHWMIKLLDKVHYHLFYWTTLPVLIAVVLFITGLPGIFLMTVASCIGAIPVFYHCRRSNCMAVLLVPIAMNMAGYGDLILRLIGLE